ncbi:cytochrome c oxidase subunit 3 family protein [Nevskia sp.]|uniref:cytochrome c oxidase subunit 3 family protein n=1 Tax=Nevskia sp. TaxID=1929292 RepID=UPI0025DE93ED|nr:cytochrome c oxidase subunit 3 family protein [Nevskia sp.]
MPVELTTPIPATAKAEPRLPGDPDLWFLILAELLTFGMFFVAYVGYRAMETEVFNASQLTLNRTLGVINTLFLLTSSWAVVSAVRAARANHSQQVPRYLALAILLGLSFMVVKYFEYSAKFAAGISLNTDTFFNFYFALTMIHLGHVIGGTVVLTVIWSNARKGAYHAGNMRGIESGATFWHLVDLLWIFLFPLLYLLR